MQIKRKCSLQRFQRAGKSHLRSLRGIDYKNYIPCIINMLEK
jgi:hypothetical protein